jgi:uncharacterized repeat protein (TIGR01451 family)
MGKTDAVAKSIVSDMLDFFSPSSVTRFSAKIRGLGQLAQIKKSLRNVIVISNLLIVRIGLALAMLMFGAVNVAATTFTMAVPNTSLTLPGTYPQAGGVAIVLEGVNGNVYYQFVNPSTMFVGYQNTGAPAIWQGNPFQIGPVMVLNCGPVVSCSTYLGGSISRMTVRFTAYDGDNQAGQFDFNDLKLQINGSNFGASNGNWSIVPTQNTSLDGLTLINSNTGYGNNTFDTGWFQSTDSAILANILSTGTITARVLDNDPNDNFWDFARGSDANTATVPLNVAPGLSVDKSSTTTSFTLAGAVIPYTFTIRNIGSVWLNSINVSDPKVSSVSCPAPPPATTANLDPGETIVCTANYTVTQADVDAGVINNTATVTGTPQAGTLGPVSDSNSIPGPASAPSVVLSKTSSPTPSFGAVGSSVAYTFSVNNTGNVTLSNVVITDPLLPSLSCTVANIAPGATNAASCTNNTLTVTQARFDAGNITNTATVTARSPSGATVSNTSSVSLTGPAQVRSASLDKTSATANFNSVGNVLSYGYAVRNTGNVTLTGVLSVSDDRTSVSCPALPSGLAPAATVICTANYTVTQADLDVGSVVNTASATIGATTSAADQVTVPALQSRTLAVDKSSSTPSFAAVGDVLSYDYVLRNTGNVTLTGAASVTDNKTAVSCNAMPVAGLAPLATLACTASYTVTQADIDAGGVTNTATGTIGSTTSPADQVTVPAVQSRSMTVDKTATSVSFVNVGDSVTYDYVVTNTGNTTLTNPITVADNRISTVSCPALPPGGLAPLATLTCTGTYTLVLADLDLGSVTNLATASSGATTSPSVSETIPAGAAPALTIDKSTGSTSFAVVGQLVPYSYVITNAGDVSFTRAITVTDNKIAGPIACYTPTGANPTFTPGETVTCSASHVVTQADIDAGFVTNQAFGATTYGAANTPITSSPDSVTVNATQAPALTVTKSATTLPVITAGQVLTYTIAVRNSGNVTLSNIIVTDPLIPSLSCTIAALAPGATNATCSGPYTVTQANFDAGVINNSATANGVTPQGAAVAGSGSLGVTIAQTNALDIAKTYSGNVDEDGSASVTLNDTLSYQVVATNTGNISQSTVVVSDPMLTPASVSCATLLPGASCTLTGTLTVTQTQVDAGQVANTASVTSNLLPTPEIDSTTVTVPQVSSMTVAKLLGSNADEDTTGSITRNDTLTYTVVMSNTGNVTQTGVTLSDPLLTPSSFSCASVAPGGTCTLEGTLVVSQSNIDAGTVANTGSATSDLIDVPETATLNTPTAQSSSLTIDKVLASNADEDTSASISLNDTLTYTVTASNDGSVTQTSVVVNDVQLTPSSITCGTVAPGANCVLTGTLKVAQFNVDAGSVTNTAGVTSTLLPTSETASATTTIPQIPAVTVDKSSSTANFDAVGDVLTYSYVITNAGNVTLTGAVSVTDNKTSVACPPVPVGGLAPGATLTCSATYAVSQADLDTGQVVNTASATVGTTTSAVDQAAVPAVQIRTLAIEKSSTTPSFDAVGDVLDYDYILRNTGNVTLTGPVSVSDDKTTVTCNALPVAGLAPLATLNCSASHTVTQADIDAGQVLNTATGTIGTTISPADQVTVTAVQSPAMTVDKNATTINFTNVGDTVEYEYIVTNTGNTTLTSAITVADNRVPTVNCPALPVGGLAPLATLTCTSAYTVQLADLQLGSVTNLATASSGSTSSSPASETVPPGAPQALTISKTSTSTSFANVGVLLPYSFAIENSGGTTLTNVINVVDDKIGTIACYTPTVADPTFIPGEVVTCTANYAVTQSDIDAGFVTNTAFASTTFGPGNTPVTSAADSLTVNAVQAPELLVSKSVATLPVAAVGQVLTYTIAVKNTGNTTASNITVTDPLIPALSCTIASLAPAVTDASCNGIYTVKQIDYDNGTIANTAHAAGITPQGAAVVDTGTLNTPIAQTSTMTVAKVMTSNADNDGSSSVTLNDVLAYTITATNTGNITQTAVTVSDPQLSPNSRICAAVVPGASCVLAGTKTVTQSEVDAGTIGNTGSVTSTRITTPVTDSINTPVSQTSSLAIVKVLSANADNDSSGGITVNDLLTYRVTMTNDGTITQKNVVVTDAMLMPTSVTCAAVAPNAMCQLNGTYRVAQADIDQGTINNMGSVATTELPTAETVSLVTSLTQVGSVAVEKSSATSSFDAVGDLVSYSYLIRNTGNVTLLGALNVSDDKTSVNCPVLPPAGLAPASTHVCTATYVVTQADLNAGSVTNTATVTIGSIVSSADQVTVAAVQKPEISVSKSSSTTSFDAVGDQLSYSYLVTNTGNVTLIGSISVSDDKTNVVCPSVPAGGLVPTASVTCSAAYSVVQSDLDAGQVVNQATATLGTVVSLEDTVTVPAVQNPTLAIEKYGSTASFNAVGDVLSYTYTLRNTGNVTLTGAVSVTDDKTPVICDPLPVGGLAPAATLSCAASYTVTQADIDAGSVTNTASGRIGTTTSPIDQVLVTAVQTRSMSVDKNATSVSFVNVGDAVTYEYVVTNTGNTTLTDAIAVSDNRVSPVNCPALPAGGLAPAASLTCTATYRLVLEDLEIGSVTNLATSTSAGTSSPPAAETVPAGANPAISLAKTSSASGFAQVGDVIAYSFVVTNSGNVSFTNAIAVNDDRIGTIACFTPTAGDPTFTPGETVTCTANDTVTQAELDAGLVTNNAFAATTYGQAGIPVTSPPASLTVNAAQAPALNVSKSVTTLPVTAVGQVLTYTIAVQNTGNVTLSNITVRDPLIPAISCTIATLAPAATDATCLGTYMVTQANFDAGLISNTATASGVTPQGRAVTDTGTLDTSIPGANPGLELSKYPSVASFTTVGEVVNFSFAVRNSGDVTLSNVTVTDPLIPGFNCVIATLAPGASNTSCAASYTVQQSDFDAGAITNNASVSATPPRGAPPSDTATVTIDGPARVANLALDKRANVSSFASVGETIGYTFTVTNMGNVTVNGPVTITDAKLALVSCPAVAAPGLLPGASLDCTGNYNVTQADIDAGSFTNSASASAATVLGPVTSPDDVEIVDATANPALTVVKSAGALSSNLGSNPAMTDAGDEIFYTFAIANTGNLTLTNISVSDAKVGSVSCPAAPLAPGASTLCTATYVLTTADMDTGSITNTATGSGTPPSGPDVSDTSGTASDNDTPTITTLPQAPGLTLVKTSSAPTVAAGANATVADVGDRIDYTFTVANTGNVSLSNITVTDAKVTPVTCVATTLAAGATTTCSGTYTLVQADLDAGTITNSALGSGNPPTGPPVTDTSGTDGGNDTPTVTTIPQTSAIALVKTAGGITDLDGNGPDVGDTITYTFTVTNSGTVTVSNISIDDPLVMAAAEPVSNPLTQLATLGPVDLTKTASLPTAAALAIATIATPLHVDVPPVSVGLGIKRQLVRLDTSTVALKAGDQVGLVFAVTNTGEGPLNNIAINQNQSYSMGGPLPYLAPNQHNATTFVFVYQLSEADVVRGGIDLPATATAMSRNTVVTQEVAGLLPLTEAKALDDMLTATITPANILTLAPGATATFDGLYTLTQANIDAGEMVNTATARGVSPDNASVTDVSDNASTAPGASEPTVTTIERTAAVDLVKTAGVPTTSLGANTTLVDAGDTIGYSFALENTGNVTLTSVGITDAKVGAISCPATTLTPGEIANCTASYVITQADIDAGRVTNTATGSGTPSTGPAATDTSGNTSGSDDETVTELVAKPAITLVKSGAAPTANLGGNTTITDVGDQIAYSFVVTNTGNVTLSGIGITDAKVGAVACPLATLAPQATTTCTGLYQLQQLDLDLGSVTNTATVTAQPPTGAPVTDVSGTADNNDEETVTALIQAPAIGLIKTAGAIIDGDGNGPDAGDTIAYTFMVRNLGNTTLLNISITDPKVPVTGGPLASLVPGASDTTTFLATYTLTQADVDAGTVSNQAEVSGTPPLTPTNPVPTPVTDTSDDDSVDPGAGDATVVTVPQNPAIGLVKLSGGVNDLDGNGPDAGDTIAYTFQVHNLGNVTLTNMRLTDPKVTVAGGPLATLAPGVIDATTFTATYELKQADIDDGQVLNTANVVGTPPTGPDVDDDSDGETPGEGPGADDATVTSITQTPDIRLIKTADISRLSQPAPLPGEPITYRFTLVNKGNVTLTNVNIADALADIVLVGGPLAELKPGEINEGTFTATYRIKVADIVAGGISNTAIATGYYEDAAGVDQTETDTSGTAGDNDTATTVKLEALPSIAIVKTAVFNDAAPTGGNLGDTITYRFVVTNTGNLPLADVGVADPKLTAVTCADTSLNPGQVTNCTAPNYALVQNDLNTGEVTNQAQAAGYLASGAVVSDLSGTAGSNNTPTVLRFPLPQATFTKSASVATAAIGDTVGFTLTAGQVVFVPATIIDTLPPGLSYVPGSAVVNGTAVEPEIAGRNLTFRNIRHVSSAIIISLRTVVNTSAKNGTLVNRAQLIHPNGTVVVRAQAVIEIRPEPVFDCGDIIGKVFDDKNGNGTQDAETSPYEPERGLAGVRVVTAKGELITTDKHGRFHIACADIPDAKIGSNFILKVDPRSLPSGYRLTTENPKVIRLTRGKMSKLNFGASIGRVIRLNLSDKAFAGGEVELPGKLKAVVQKLITVLDEEPSVLRLQYQVGAAGKAAALRRVEEAERYIREQWQQEGGRYKLPIETRLLKLQQESQK